MKLRPITWAVIVGVLLAAGTAGLLVVSALNSFEHSCEVCMSFRGDGACRTATGQTEEEATRTATDNACAVLGARGMTLSVECTNTPPVSVTCSDGR